jgi:hypothetical protein
MLYLIQYTLSMGTYTLDLLSAGLHSKCRDSGQVRVTLPGLREIRDRGFFRGVCLAERCLAGQNGRVNSIDDEEVCKHSIGRDIWDVDLVARRIGSRTT